MGADSFEGWISFAADSKAYPMPEPAALAM